MTCPRALRYKQLDRRIPIAESAALNFGSAIHLALEYRYRHYESSPVDVFYQDGLTPILSQHFDEHPTPMDDWRTINWCMELVNKYNDRYGQEEFSLLRYKEPKACPQCQGNGWRWKEGTASLPCYWCHGLGKTEVMVELPFALSLFETTHAGKKIHIMYTGKIDLPNVKEGGIWVDDHKSASQLGPSFFERMKMSSQQKGYAWAFEQLTGEKVVGFEINAIRSKEPPQYVINGTENKRGKSQSPEMWWKETFQREKYRLRPDDLVEWKGNVINILEEFLWNYARGVAPMKTMWCNQFGRCPYYDVCSMEQQDRGVYLASGLFTDNTWSPLKQPTQSKQ